MPAYRWSSKLHLSVIVEGKPVFSEGSSPVAGLLQISTTGTEKSTAPAPRVSLTSKFISFSSLVFLFRELGHMPLAKYPAGDAPWPAKMEPSGVRIEKALLVGSGISLVINPVSGSVISTAVNAKPFQS